MMWALTQLLTLVFAAFVARINIDESKNSLSIFVWSLIQDHRLLTPESSS